MCSLKYTNPCHGEGGLLLLEAVKNVDSGLPSILYKVNTAILCMFAYSLRGAVAINIWLIESYFDCV